MTHFITDACRESKDGACVKVCPVDCIHPAKEESGHDDAPQLYIDPDSCIDCGACLEECPVSAIYRSDSAPAEMQAFVEMNAAFFRRAVS